MRMLITAACKREGLNLKTSCSRTTSKHWLRRSRWEWALTNPIWVLSYTSSGQAQSSITTSRWAAPGAIDSAYGILLSGAEDDQIADFFIRTAFPSEEEVSQILGVLREAKGPLKRANLQQRLNLSGGKLDDALKF